MNIKESLEEFYENLLGVEYPWSVESICRDSKRREVTVIVGYSKEEPYKCPVCGKGVSFMITANGGGVI